MVVGYLGVRVASWPPLIPVQSVAACRRVRCSSFRILRNAVLAVSTLAVNARCSWRGLNPLILVPT